MPENIVNNALRRRVIDETLAFLVTCGHDAIADFIRQVNRERNAGLLVVGGNKLLLKQIKEHLGKSFPEQDLLDYADARRMYGPQHIFLYKAGKQDAGILRDLQSQSHVKRLLARHNLADRYNKAQLIWDSPAPKLASVMYIAEARAILIFKWVETRTWSNTVTSNGNAKSPPLVVTKKERSVNFFRVNLDTGECEIGIQKLNPSPRLSLQEEHDLYIDLAKKILGIDQLHRINLEPVIRRLLDSKDIKIKSWKVAYERGGDLRGSRDPNLAQRINLFMTPFIGMELNNVWVSDRHAGAFTSFYAKNDEVFVHNHFADQPEMDDVLDRIRRYSEIKILNPMLRELASTHERLEPALSAIDSKISRSGKDNIDCRKLADDHWIPQADMLEAVETLMSINRNRNELHNMFQIKYQVVCPDSNKPILDETGKPVEFHARSDIPNRINCRHSFPEGVKKHPTQGNIKPIIKALPAPNFWNVGMLGIAERPSGLLNFMQKHLGKKFGLKTIQITLGLFYSALFIFAALQIINVMLASAVKFPDEKDALTFMFAALTLALVLILFIFLITLFGSKAMRQALDALKQFTEMVFSIFKKKPAQDNRQNAHKKRALRRSADQIKQRHAAQTK